MGLVKGNFKQDLASSYTGPNGARKLVKTPVGMKFNFTTKAVV